jgi:hypothetical protein
MVEWGLTLASILVARVMEAGEEVLEQQMR